MNIYETHSAEETFALGKKIGESAEPDTVIALSGDIGNGKTVFTKGVAAGLGITEHVTSPTFTILHSYDEGRLPLFHFDVYRIGDVSEMDEIGCEDCFYGGGVSLVEWAELVPEIFPPETVAVRIEKDLSKGTDYRRISIGTPAELGGIL